MCVFNSLPVVAFVLRVKDHTAWTHAGGAQVAQMIGLDPTECERPEFALAFSGAAHLPGSKPFAQNYGMMEAARASSTTTRLMHLTLPAVGLHAGGHQVRDDICRACTLAVEMEIALLFVSALYFCFTFCACSLAPGQAS